MAIPFIVAAGLGVMVAAKTASWIYNTLSEQEREKQQQERERSDQIRARFREANIGQEAEQRIVFRKMGEEHAQFLLASIGEHRQATAEVSVQLAELERMISREASDKTSSPYRKSALRREYTRIEDAIVRMQEYQHYLDREERRINALLESETYEDLLGLDTAQPLLPLEWLYPGKLILVSMDEIGKPLPNFGHRISFGFEDLAQRSLAIRYGDDIPLLIKSVHNRYPDLFYGCVARGAAHYHHIMPGQPVEFTVERVSGDTALGTMFDGVLRAALPRSQLSHPGIRLLSGQKILVHPLHYDLCLNRDPFENKSRCIEVSEFNYQSRDIQSYQQIYLEVDEETLRDVTDDRFFDPNEPWTLLNHASVTGTISLAKATVRVECQPQETRKTLDVREVIQMASPQIGQDTPFRFTLIDRSLAQTEQIGWVSGVEEFLRFSAQAGLDMSASPERLAQSRFYQRWEQVIAYQRHREEDTAMEYPLEFSRREDGVLSLSRDALPQDQREQFAHVSAKLSVLLSSDSTQRAKFDIAVQIWDAARNAFIPALRTNRRTPPHYAASKDCIRIEGDFSPLIENAKFLKLLIHVPSQSLARQEQALDDFFRDRLVNPALKNVLLNPERYLPDQDEPIGPIAWSGSLDDSQKRVVELALRERNIALIQGPPGAGKTTAIVEMLHQLFSQRPNRRVLVVSQQNSAVDNALSKFLDTRGPGPEISARTIRIGDPAKMTAAITPLSFDRLYAEYLAELDSRAVQAAVSLPEDQTTLCCSWRTSLQQTAESRVGHDEFFITLLADHNLVGATCVGLATNKGGIDQLRFDVAIIDEAGRSTVPEILIPILRSDKVILIGDHYQLPPSISPLLREDDARQELTFLQDNFLDGSFFQSMFESLPPACRGILDRQYRMAPAIGDLVANLFYSCDGHRTLHNGLPNSNFDSRYVLDRSIYWVDVKGRQHQPRNSTSQENVREAEEIAGFLARLAEQVEVPTSVAVITPYGAQKACIRERLHPIGQSDKNLLTINVDTVDAFQGKEADIVCYSTVRTSGSLNFILDRKRLNVACSRAKLHLLFFGDRDYLCRWTAKEQPGANLFPKIVEHANTEVVRFRRRMKMDTQKPLEQHPL